MELVCRERVDSGCGVEFGVWVLMDVLSCMCGKVEGNGDLV